MQNQKTVEDIRSGGFSTSNKNIRDEHLPNNIVDAANKNFSTIINMVQQISKLYVLGMNFFELNTLMQNDKEWKQLDHTEKEKLFFQIVENPPEEAKEKAKIEQAEKTRLDLYFKDPKIYEIVVSGTNKIKNLTSDGKINIALNYLVVHCLHCVNI